MYPRAGTRLWWARSCAERLGTRSPRTKMEKVKSEVRTRRMRTKSLEEKTWKSEVRTRMTRRSLEERTWRSEVRTRSLEERTCESSLKRWCDPRREMQGWPSLSFLA